MTRLYRLRLAIVFLSLIMLGTRPALASEEFHANHVAILIGGMTPLAESSQTSFALGLDYERRINPIWGAVAGLDVTVGSHERSSLAAVGVTYRLTPALKLGTGPGFEVVEVDQEDGSTKNKVHFLWGMGAAYEFHVGWVSLAPTVLLDFAGETKTNLTYGLAVGAGF